MDRQTRVNWSWEGLDDGWMLLLLLLLLQWKASGKATAGEKDP
jgi:hypothetical protein